jgi:hypothetical protein
MRLQPVSGGSGIHQLRNHYVYAMSALPPKAEILHCGRHSPQLAAVIQGTSRNAGTRRDVLSAAITGNRTAST